MINREQLKFPSGIAAAETLRSLHSKGTDAVKKARSLGIAGLVGALTTWLRDAGIPFQIPSHLGVPGSIGGFALSKYTISLEMSAIMIAAGAIIGWKVAWSMLAGAILNYSVLAPWMVSVGAIDGSKLGYRAIVSWSTWTGASIMVTSGLFYFFLHWKTIVRALLGFKQLILTDESKNNENDPLSKIEVPTSWFFGGTLLSGAGCVFLLWYAFGTTWWVGVIAVLIAFLLSMVACRVAGESDITPMGAMGKIAQLTFGVIVPSNITTNLMTASVTAGAATSSADLLTDLKSGYLLGANPRKQFLAQFFGVFAGTLVVVPAFYIIVPNASVLGGDQWPAPAAQVWAAVAKLLANGLNALHPTAQVGLLVGGVIGIILPLLELSFPRYRHFVPSATGLGLSMVIPFFNSLSIFIGATIATVLGKWKPSFADLYVIPVASGIIAGESLIGILVAVLAASGLL